MLCGSRPLSARLYIFRSCGRSLFRRNTGFSPEIPRENQLYRRRSCFRNCDSLWTGSLSTLHYIFWGEEPAEAAHFIPIRSACDHRTLFFGILALYITHQLFSYVNRRIEIISHICAARHINKAERPAPNDSSKAFRNKRKLFN